MQMNYNILTKTAEDLGHIDLSSAGWVKAGNSGPIPIPQVVRSGALFVFNAGLDRTLILSPALNGIGYEHNRKGYSFIRMRFTENIPRDLRDRLEMIDMYAPVFLILKMEEKKSSDLMIGPGRVWEQGYFIHGVLMLNQNEVVLVGSLGDSIR